VTTPSGAGPFVVNVAGLLGDDVGAQRTVEIRDATIDLPDELELAAPIDGTIRLTHENRGVLVDARLTTSLAGECARCLRPLQTLVEIELDEEYLPSIDLTTGRPVDQAAEPDALRLTDHHEVDLGPSVRDAISLAEPIAPLHDPDCQGLCIVCGRPLDEGTHDHPDDDIDPRLEALRGFHADRDE
jgi:uncharacterized protein